MKEIPLTHGRVAFVDDGDYDLLAQKTWHTRWGCGTCYAYTNIKTPSGRYTTRGMHQIINGTPAGFDTDHADGNGLNNTRANLRTASRTENARNRNPNKTGTSKYKGVYWDKQKQCWRVSIRVNTKLLHIGLFRDELKAAEAYNIRAAHEFGNFSKGNAL